MGGCVVAEWNTECAIISHYHFWEGATHDVTIIKSKNRTTFIGGAAGSKHSKYIEAKKQGK